MTEAIRKLIKTNKWKPIEEAPRDGTTFIAKSDLGGTWAMYDHTRNRFVMSYSGRDFPVEWLPTHFRHIPDNRLAEMCEVLLGDWRNGESGGVAHVWDETVTDAMVKAYRENYGENGLRETMYAVAAVALDHYHNVRIHRANEIAGEENGAV